MGVQMDCNSIATDQHDQLRRHGRVRGDNAPGREPPHRRLQSRVRVAHSYPTVQLDARRTAQFVQSRAASLLLPRTSRAVTEFPIYLFIFIVFLNRYVFGLWLTLVRGRKLDATIS